MALQVPSNLFPGVFRLVIFLGRLGGEGAVTQKVVMFQSHIKCICNLRFCASFPKSSTEFSKFTKLLKSSSIWVWAPQYTPRFLCMSGDSLFCTLMRLFWTPMSPISGETERKEKCFNFTHRCKSLNCLNRQWLEEKRFFIPENKD